MFDDFFYILSGVMVLYWICWLAGFKVPGCGKEDFHGWLYCKDDFDDESVGDGDDRQRSGNGLTHQH